MGECPFKRGAGGDSVDSVDSGDSRGTDDPGEPDRATVGPGGNPHGWRSGAPVGRRAVLRSAVAIGGVSALSTALSVEGAAADGNSTPWPQGDPANRPERQHTWSPVGETDEFGNPVPPSHQVVLLASYGGEDIEADREVVEASFHRLEQAFAYDQADGLLFNVGYSPAYFKRHSRGTPEGVDITEPRSVSPHNEPELNRQDLFVQLASDRAAIVLTAEEALFGEVDSANGVEIEHSLADHCTKVERRAVFAGPGLPADRIDNDAIHEDAPLSMGFDSVYADSIPPESRVTIADGPWADGTVAMVSKLRLHLEEWYEERTRAERIDEMFAPQYTGDDVGRFGEGLGKGSGRGDGEGWERELTERTEEDAREKGVVGHSQKVARARDDEFDVDLLRRDGDITIDGSGGGLSFVGLVEGISDWFDVADAMYDEDLDGTLRREDGVGISDSDTAGETAAGGTAGGTGAGTAADPGAGAPGGPAADPGARPGADEHHPRSGIAAQVDVRARGHYLIPPRSLRALPPSRP